MRLARLVAAGLALGAVSGFLAAFLRPRSAQTYGQHYLVHGNPHRTTDDHADEPGAADDPDPSPTRAPQQRTAMNATDPHTRALVAVGTVA